MSRIKRLETVIWSATLRAAGSRVFEISQRINSASTADRAMVVEKVMADRLLTLDMDDVRSHEFEKDSCGSGRLLIETAPDSKGSNRSRTIALTMRKVKMNGSEERTTGVIA